MTAPASLGLSLLLFLATAGPAGATPSAAGPHQYVYFVNGQSIGSERFEVESRGDTLLLDGELLLNQPAERRLELSTRVAGPDEHLVSYLLRSTAGDSLGARALGDTLHLFSVGAAGDRARQVVPGEARAAILDNGIASHLWLLARQLARDPAREDSLLAIVPQQLWTGPLLRDTPQPATATLEGEPVEVLRHRITLAGALTLVDTGEGGDFYSVKVPAKRFEIRRIGYRTGPTDTDPGAAEPHFVTEALRIDGGGPLLGGTLTLPEGDGPWPACLLLHGAGPVDRDMTLGPNTIFAQLADGLAARGIASLRYDKRTYVQNRGKEDPSRYGDRSLTLRTEVLDDAHAAHALLRGDRRFDPQRLLVVGLDLGAGAAATLARELDEAGEPLAGLVLLAPPGRDLLSIMLDQYQVLHDLGGVSDADIERAAEGTERLREGLLGEDDIVFNAKPRYWNSVMFWKPWRDYTEQPAPALVLFGARDYQITTPDQEKWRDVLAGDGRPASRLEVLPRLNHLFLPGSGPSGPAEYGVPGRLEDSLLDEIGDWMRARRVP